MTPGYIGAATTTSKHEASVVHLSSRIHCTPSEPLRSKAQCVRSENCLSIWQVAKIYPLKEVVVWCTRKFNTDANNNMTGKLEKCASKSVFLGMCSLFEVECASNVADAKLIRWKIQHGRQHKLTGKRKKNVSIFVASVLSRLWNDFLIDAA